MEVQPMRSEYLSSMRGICGGPCGVYGYLEKTSNVLTTTHEAPKLPWLTVAHLAESAESAESKEFHETEQSSAKFCRSEGALLASGFTPAQLFGDSAMGQIVRSQRRLSKIQGNLVDFSLKNY